MDKDRIQSIADAIAQEDYGQEFYDLAPRMQIKVYNLAIDELNDMMAGKADMMRKNEADGGRIKLEAGGYLDYVRAVKELGFQPIRIDEYKSLQGSMDMSDIIKLTERINMVNKKVE